MRKSDAYQIIAEHTDMFNRDLEKNILIPLENATPEVVEAIKEINSYN